MRKLIIRSVSIAVGIVLIFQFSEVRTNIIQPQAERTGAPDELTCGDGTACHNTTPNTGPGNVSILYSDLSNNYIPGNTYQLTFTVTEATMTRFGFECTSLDANGDSAGTWLSAVSGSIAFPTVPSDLHRRYVSHHNASSNNVWVVNWKAPATDKGPLTFYAAGNAANGNQLSTGDHIYTTSLAVTPLSIGIDEASDPYFFSVQNPVSDQLNIRYRLPATSHFMIRLFNTNGQLLKTLQEGNENAGFHLILFDVSDLSAGMYLIRFDSEANSQTAKIIVE